MKIKKIITSVESTCVSKNTRENFSFVLNQKTKLVAFEVLLYFLA